MPGPNHGEGRRTIGPRRPLAHAILGVLDARPVTDRELVRFFDQSTGWVWSAPQSQVHRQLRAMESDGLIAAGKEIGKDKLQRTVYSITDNGRAELEEWVASSGSSGPDRDALLLRALFFDMIEPERAIAVLESFINQQQEPLARWTEQREQAADPEAHVFEGKIEVAQARIDWARRGIELLSSKR